MQKANLTVQVPEEIDSLLDTLKRKNGLSKPRLVSAGILALAGKSRAQISELAALAYGEFEPSGEICESCEKIMMEGDLERGWVDASGEDGFGSVYLCPDCKDCD